MPDERMDVKTPIKKSDGTSFWMKIGAAFPNRNGPGYMVKLNVLPMGGPDGASMIIVPVDDTRQVQGGRQQAPASTSGPARYAPRPPSASQGGNPPAPIDPNDELPPW